MIQPSPVPWTHEHAMVHECMLLRNTHSIHLRTDTMRMSATPFFLMRKTISYPKITISDGNSSLTHKREGGADYGMKNMSLMRMRQGEAGKD